MIGKLKRLLATSPHELAGRAAQALWQVAERTPLPLDRPLLAHAPAAAAARALMSGETPFFPAFRDQTPDQLTAALPREHVQWVMREAECIVRGYAPVLGHGPLFVGQPPQWHREPIAGLDAPRVHWSRVPYLDRHVVGDHKVLWEFNRHQHLLTLAQAWRLSGNAQWLQQIAQQWQSWLAQNPPRLGVNWASSLEVAYRSMAWLWVLAVCGPLATHTLGEPLLGDLVRSLQAHGRHVERYLSHWFSPNTHLTGEALGLLYLGVALPSLPESARWRRVATDILQQQALVQIHPDGVYFEQATQYHRYTCDIYLHALLLGEIGGMPFSPAVRQRVRQAFTVLHALQRPDGTIALLGDDDGGRLLPIDAEAPHEVGGLLSAAAAWFNDPALLPVEPTPVQCLALLGDKALPAGEPPRQHSAAFPFGGQYVIADSLPQGGHLTLSCGPHGGLSCGHSHADELSFELWVGGAPLLVDRGTFAYDGPERNAFRETAAHNTLQLGGEGVSLPDRPFRWSKRVDAVCDSWVDRGTWSCFEGHHDGYTQLAPGARHSRTIWRPAPGLWVIQDAVPHTAGHEAVVRWYLAPGTNIETSALPTSGPVTLQLERPNAAPASMMIMGADRVAWQETTVSPQYGAQRPARVVNAAAHRAELVLTTVLIDWSVFDGTGVMVHAENELPVEVKRHGHSTSDAVQLSTLVLGGSAPQLADVMHRALQLSPPVPLGAVLAFRTSPHSDTIVVGQSLDNRGVPTAERRNVWYECAAVVLGEPSRWRHGPLGPVGC